MSRLFVALLFLLACSRPEQPEFEFPGAPVILISIDTLRSDRLPAYGYTGVETPHLDRFRRDAVLFERAYSHSPMTLPSHVSMLTGTAPHEHGVRDNAGFRFDGTKHPTLPAALRTAGYATGAAVSSWVLRGETGLRPLFDFYEDSIAARPGAPFDEHQRPGSDTAALALPWIRERASSPFFFLFHIYEPHVPYAPPEPFRSRYAARPYDGEIAGADAIVGAFLDELRAIGLYDRALIVITSDHGEGLGDHGEQQHSILIYREALQVPLFIKLPGGASAGTTIGAPVQLSDLAPTIAALTGASLPARGNARNIFESDEEPGERSIYAESLYPKLHFGWSGLRSLIRGSHHYIESPRPELYDLAADPAERANLLESERRVAAALRAELAGIPMGNDRPEPVDAETAQRLASLGYLGSAAKTTGPLANPADEIALLEEIASAFTLAATDPSAAEPRLRALLERQPSLLDVRLRLAGLLADSEREEEALREYRTAMETSGLILPDVLLDVAALHLRLGQMDDAGRHARLALAELPERGHATLARIAIERGDLVAAEREAALAAANGSPASLVLQAEIAQRRGDLAGALRFIGEAERRAALLRSGPVFRLEFVRGDILARMERFDEAAAAHRREVEAFPSNLDAWAALAVVELLRGADPEPVLAEMLRRNPTGRALAYAERTRRSIGQ